MDEPRITRDELIEQLNSYIEAEAELNDDSSKAVISLVERIKGMVDDRQSLTPEAIEEIGDQIYNATQGESGYGDTDFSDEVMMLLGDYMGF